MTLFERKEEQHSFGLWVTWVGWIEKKNRGSLGFNIGRWSSWDETLKQIRDRLYLLSPLAQNRSESAQALISNLPLLIFVLLLILSNIFVFPCYSHIQSELLSFAFWEFDPIKLKCESTRTLMGLVSCHYSNSQFLDLQVW